MPSSAACQLYLEAPTVLPADFAATLAAVLDAASIACLRLPARPDIRELVGLAQGRHVAVLLDGDADLAAQLGADGVHLVDPQSYGVARRKLIEPAIVGVYCDRSRHTAMEAGEAGADYVAFGPDVEIVRWWAELMVVPQVVELGDAAGRFGEFVAAGADFICPGQAIWHDPAGAGAAIARLLG